MDRGVWQRSATRKGTTVVFLCGLLALPVAGTEAGSSASASSLSRWLSNEPIAELGQQFAQHPRFAGAGVSISHGTPDALAEAIATLLLRNLSSSGVVRVNRAHAQAQTGGLVSIDDLRCDHAPGSDYHLSVDVSAAGNRRAAVTLRLSDTAGGATLVRDWSWRGRLSGAETEYLRKPAQQYLSQGTLEHPWNADQFDAAARQLGEALACKLRPGVRDRISLDWTGTSAAQQGLPSPFADTGLAARAMLAGFREFELVDRDSDITVDYRVEVEVLPMSNDLWQLWLRGIPTANTLPAVQAVTYFHAPSATLVPAATRPLAAALPGGLRPQEDPLEFLQVQLLDATQSERDRRSATLEVTLRLTNSGDWPMDYAFSLSGGHFNHCIARDSYYRHDQYGNASGTLAAGESRMQRLVIENATHRPTPYFGTRQCAGFRDLDGFEDFARQGHKVTEYVRWSSVDGGAQ